MQNFFRTTDDFSTKAWLCALAMPFFGIGSSMHAACLEIREIDCNYFEAASTDSVCTSTNDFDDVVIARPVSVGTGAERSDEGCGFLVNPNAITDSGSFLSGLNRLGKPVIIRIYRKPGGALNGTCGGTKPGAPCKEP